MGLPHEPLVWPTPNLYPVTFTIARGGPTGVELAGAIAEFARFVLPVDFRRIDTMPARHLARLEQEIDRRGMRAAQRIGGIAKTFAEMPAFRMRLQIQQGDEAIGFRHACFRQPI